MRAGIVGLALASHLVAGTVLSEVAAPDLIGDWVGEATVNDHSGELILHIEAGEAGVLNAAISMPPIEARHIPIGRLVVEGNTIRLGPASYEYDPTQQTLSGNLPSFFVPVHKIPITLRRGSEPVSFPAAKNFGRPNQPLWSVTTGGQIYASPVVADDRVHIGSDDHHLYTLEAATGALVWKVETGGAIRARPTIAGDALYIPADDGYLYKLRRDDGREIWRVRVGADPAPRTVPGNRDSQYDNFASAVAVAGKTLYLGTLDGDVLALDSDEGSITWRFECGGAVQSTPLVIGKTVVFGSFDHFVYALDRASGELTWRFDTGAPVTSSAAAFEDTIIIGSRSYDLFALDLNTGKPSWRDYYWYSWVESSARVVDDTVYIGSSDAGYLLALDAASGKREWVFDTAGSAWGQPAVGESEVYIGSVGVNGYIADHQPGIYAVARDSGQPVWSYLPLRPEEGGNSGFASSPAIDDERVYIGGIDGRVYAFPRQASR